MCGCVDRVSRLAISSGLAVGMRGGHGGVISSAAKSHAPSHETWDMSASDLLLCTVSHRETLCLSESQSEIAAPPLQLPRFPEGDRALSHCCPTPPRARGGRMGPSTHPLPVSPTSAPPDDSQSAGGIRPRCPITRPRRLICEASRRVPSGSAYARQSTPTLEAAAIVRSVETKRSANFAQVEPAVGVHRGLAGCLGTWGTLALPFTTSHAEMHSRRRSQGPAPSLRVFF
ncbi:hypothetical protein K458DRAFT_483141 [Lentithecium fluviatile CBS 122367]|uniref:Uncharacterized protein n=1 Tax=Lentithecium fluviatile CBS 122367 TaxID=1168545 RepID=A0A6G1JKM0_9PLEO|nr:hypothetical protein K458DRAFT_483141 [Lentithecium fluviatile CBS 122367]